MWSTPRVPAPALHPPSPVDTLTLKQPPPPAPCEGPLPCLRRPCSASPACFFPSGASPLAHKQVASLIFKEKFLLISYLLPATRASLCFPFRGRACLCCPSLLSASSVDVVPSGFQPHSPTRTPFVALPGARTGPAGVSASLTIGFLPKQLLQPLRHFSFPPLPSSLSLLFSLTHFLHFSLTSLALNPQLPFLVLPHLSSF